MTEELKSLIAKIQEEGVKAAEDKARAIEEEATKNAQVIIDDARKKAEALIDDAKDKIERMEKSAKALLKQAGRDLMLSLRKEINNMLDKLVVSHVQETLEPNYMARMIETLVEGAKTEEKKDITVLLSKTDLNKLEKALLKELKEATKKGITIKASGDIRGGFLISYDKGKSFYDFSDKTLAEYLASSVKPKLAEMLKNV